MHFYLLKGSLSSQIEIAPSTDLATTQTNRGFILLFTLQELKAMIIEQQRRHMAMEGVYRNNTHTSVTEL